MQLDWSREIESVEMVEVCVFLNGRVDELAHIHRGQRGEKEMNKTIR